MPFAQAVWENQKSRLQSPVAAETPKKEVWGTKREHLRSATCLRQTFKSNDSTMFARDGMQDNDGRHWLVGFIGTTGPRMWPHGCRQRYASGAHADFCSPISMSRSKIRQKFIKGKSMTKFKNKNIKHQLLRPPAKYARGGRNRRFLKYRCLRRHFLPHLVLVMPIPRSRRRTLKCSAAP